MLWNVSWPSNSRNTAEYSEQTTKLGSWITSPGDSPGSADCCKPMSWSKGGYFQANGESAGICWQSSQKSLGACFFPVVFVLCIEESLFRDHLTTLLTQSGSNLTVKSLLDNLQITLEFEQTMAKKWATSVSRWSINFNVRLLKILQFKDILKATDNPQSEPGKPMSAAFEPHMGIFVDAQDK